MPTQLAYRLRIHRTTLVAPGCTHKAKHVGNLLITQLFAESRHAIGVRHPSSHHPLRTIKCDIDCRGVLLGQCRGRSGQWRHPLVLALAVQAVAGGTACHVGAGSRAVQPYSYRFGLVLPWLAVTFGVAGQRLQVVGDGGQVVVMHELRGVVERLCHRTEYHCMPVAPGLQELRDLRLAPAPESCVVVGAQAGCIPAVKQCTGQERLAAVIQRLFIEGQAAWRVATAAVPGALDDIGATVPLCILPGLVGVRPGGGKQAVPQGNGPAQVQRPGDVAGQVGLPRRLHTVHEERIQRLDVLIAELGVGRVRHGRVQPPTTGRDTLAHGAVEVGQGVVTDAVVAVRGDVGGVDRPQRGGHFQPAGERFAIRQAMAGHAVTEPGHVFAAADQRRVGNSGLRIGKRRSRFACDIPGQ